MTDRVEVELVVNGVARNGSVEPRRTLADFIREELDLTGTHIGCEHGVCGACTVLIDGSAVRSCLTLAVQARGTEVTTIEGLAADGQMSALQTAMWSAHAFQCGFCTPGFLMQITELLNDGAALSELAVREALSGNICRCSGYQTIVDAVLACTNGSSDTDEQEVAVREVGR